MDVFTPMWLYIVQCADGSYYTGVTTNLERRLKEHNTTKNRMHYVATRQPVKYVYREEYPSHAPAYKREKEIKKLSHEEKWRLIEHGKQLEESGMMKV
jgi:putative endonuclease